MECPSACSLSNCACWTILDNQRLNCAMPSVLELPASFCLQHLVHVQALTALCTLILTNKQFNPKLATDYKHVFHTA